MNPMEDQNNLGGDAGISAKWLRWAKRLQAIAQNGLTFAEDPFDVERYEAVRKTAADMLAVYGKVTQRHIDDLFADEKGYATPKLDVRGAVFRDDTILLVRERTDGLWTLPGGWVDVNNSPSEAVEREVYEESGYRVRAAKLLAVWDRDRQGHPPHPFHIYKLVFLCDLVGGAPAHSIETDAVDFFGMDELPELSLTRVLPAQIGRLFEHNRHMEWPADFD